MTEKKLLKEIGKLINKAIKETKAEFKDKEFRSDLENLIFEHAPFLVESRLQELAQGIIDLIKKK